MKDIARWTRADWDRVLNNGKSARRFVLRRDEDESGISGTGIVAEGIRFTTGKAVLNWITDFRSVAVYDSLDELMAIHGHDGKTVLVWIDQ